MRCLELLADIEARLDFDDDMPPLDADLVRKKMHAMSHDVENALESANYNKLLQSGLQVLFGPFISKRLIIECVKLPMTIFFWKNLLSLLNIDCII